MLSVSLKEFFLLSVSLEALFLMHSSTILKRLFKKLRLASELSDIYWAWEDTLPESSAILCRIGRIYNSTSFRN